MVATRLLLSGWHSGLPGRRRGRDRIEFDRDFFGLSASTAASMPVRDQAVLELAWSALADAGVLPDELTGRTAGVFLDANAGGVAEFLRLTGPVAPVRCGAGSAVLAVQAACRSLLTGECDVRAGRRRAWTGLWRGWGERRRGSLVTGARGRRSARADPAFPRRSRSGSHPLRHPRRRGRRRGPARMTRKRGWRACLPRRRGWPILPPATCGSPSGTGRSCCRRPRRATAGPCLPDDPGPARVLPWVLSAKTTRSLRGQAALLAAHVAGPEELHPAGPAEPVPAGPGTSARG